ncbi:phage regulatory CII family protein [Maridesulfovibrio sp.]|jgi:DNA-binding Lrp family transcriptional regulator|uniref:phage regulatory CII family protein n=1 Tax=Maridesulfovibrio sp. TaxID=2795000 RepID=UPI0029CA5C4F|nr:phage regulatory CII family protein [Maridesulfovibrio sp.]
MSEKVEKAIQDLVLNGPVSLEELAEKLGKSPKTLAREANPEDRKAKLGAETLIEIMRITGGVEPLRLMAEELEMTLESLD